MAIYLVGKVIEIERLAIDKEQLISYHIAIFKKISGTIDYWAIYITDAFVYGTPYWSEVMTCLGSN